MKGVLGWIKSNLLIVISVVVIVVSLPTGFVLSQGWNKKIRDEQQKKGTDAYNKVKNAKVTYVVPSLLPDEEAVQFSQPPNSVVTKLVAQERSKRDAQATSILSQVEAFNKRDHENMAPGLLPKPANERESTRLTYAFLSKMAGDSRLGVKTIYADLFEQINAGGPPDPIRLATTIEDIAQRETERMLAESGGSSLSPEQQETLRKLLVDRRIAETQRQAKALSVYGDLGVFDSTAFGPKSAVIPPLDRNARESIEKPTLDEMFEWNFDYWVVSDVLDAIDLANTDAGGTRANIEHAAVKRLESIGVEALLDPATADAGSDDASSSDTEIAGPSEGKDPSVSHTGRISTSEYDVVNVKLRAVVASSKLPDVVKAFADTNLMTVTDMDISDVDLWGDLRDGYFYGSEPVVRVEMTVETIWLRSWTEPMMPDSVKKRLGIPVEDEDNGEG